MYYIAEKSINKVILSSIPLQYFQGIGEPPYLLSATVLGAIKDAVQAARAQIGLHGHFILDSPATVERIKNACGDQLKMRNKEH